jgi:hypothetical protein
MGSILMTFNSVMHPARGQGKVHGRGKVMIYSGSLTLQRVNSALTVSITTAYRHDAVVGLDRAERKVSGLRLCALTKCIEQCRLQQYKNMSETGDNAPTQL